MLYEDKRINEVIESALINVKKLIDADTVVGTPVSSVCGDTVIPVSKVTCGILSAGGEYGKINLFQKDKDLPYSAGNGTVVSIKPCGFLIKSGTEYKVVSFGGTPSEAILDKATDFLLKISGDKDEKK